MAPPVAAAGDAGQSRTSGSLQFPPLTAHPSTLSPSEVRKPRPFLLEWALAGCATMSACLFTNPSEVIKTRLQVQNELVSQAHAVSGAAPPPKLYRNVFHAFWVVGRTEGLRGLQGGLGPSLVYQLAMNGCRLGMYEPLKRVVTRMAEGEAPHEGKLGDHVRPHRPPVFLHNVIAAAGSGCTAAFIASPFFLVKVRLQIQSKAAAAAPLLAVAAAKGGSAAPVLPHPVAPGVGVVGAQHAYTGAWAGLKAVYAADGLTGLWRGAPASMLRVSTGSVVQLSSYDSIKYQILQRTGWSDGVRVHVCASLLSGLLVTVAMNPPDVISTRLYNQPVVNGRGTLYSGLADCLMKTARAEGLSGHMAHGRLFACVALLVINVVESEGFYKGFTAHYLRLGPHTLLTFVFWEQIKAAATKAGI